MINSVRCKQYKKTFATCNSSHFFTKTMTIMFKQCSTSEKFRFSWKQDNPIFISKPVRNFKNIRPWRAYSTMNICHQYLFYLRRINHFSSSHSKQSLVILNTAQYLYIVLRCREIDSQVQYLRKSWTASSDTSMYVYFLFSCAKFFLGHNAFLLRR